MLTRFNSNTEGQVGKVDKENGIIYGVSVITGNREALGHEMFIDDTTVDQVVAFGQESDKGVGLKARFDHPNACFSSMGTQLGRFKNFRREGDKAIADLHLLEANKEHRDFILGVAEEDPDMFATSIVFNQGDPYTPQFEDHPDKEETDAFFFPHARVDSLMACDVVDEGAANDGLFGRPDYLAEQAEKWASEHKEIIEPILFKIFEKYEKQKNMEPKKEDVNENKSPIKEGVEALKATYTAILEKLNIKSDDKSEDETENETSVEDFKEKLETLTVANEQLTTENAELLGRNEETAQSLKEMGDKIEELSTLKIGEAIDATGGGQTDATYKETKEDKKEKRAQSLQEARNDIIKQKGY